MAEILSIIPSVEEKKAVLRRLRDQGFRIVQLSDGPGQLLKMPKEESPKTES